MPLPVGKKWVNRKTLGKVLTSATFCAKMKLSCFCAFHKAKRKGRPDRAVSFFIWLFLLIYYALHTCDYKFQRRAS